jgi:hypothetical protein
MAIDARIKQAEDHLTALRRAREHILALEAPIARLAPEVLARVMAFAVHDDYSYRTLETVQLVSRSWHALALQTPALWSHIRCDPSAFLPRNGSPGAPSQHRDAVILRRIQSMLSRSADSDLHIELEISQDHPVMGDGLLAGFLGLLTPHLRRCRKLELKHGFREAFVIPPCLQELAVLLGDTLEEVVLTYHWQPWRSPLLAQVPVAAFEVPSLLAPGKSYARLHTLSIDVFPLSRVQGAYLPALRVLTLGRKGNLPGTYTPPVRTDALSLSHLMTFLSAYPSLVDVSLHAIRLQLGEADALQAEEPQLALAPALTSLRFENMGNTDIGALLTLIDAPRLEQLCVHMVDKTNGDWGDAGFLADALAGGRFPAARLLALRGLRMEGTALLPLVRVFRTLPQLQALSLWPSGNILGADLFGALGAPAAGSGAWLLPRLTCLALAQCDPDPGWEPDDGIGAKVLRLVRARRAAQLGALGGGEVSLLQSPVERVRYVQLFQCMSVDRSGVDALRSVLDDVVWDKHPLEEIMD